MSGTCSHEDDGRVFLAHAWVSHEHKKFTVGPWHWWNVYRDIEAARAQAARRARGWGAYGQWEVNAIRSEAHA